MNLARQRLGLAATERRFPAKATCLTVYSRAVNAQEDLGRVLRDRFPWCAGWEAELRALFAAYTEAKQAMAVLDYDDLLLYWAGMMQDPGLARETGDRFDHVLVDEFQDTNRLQAAILAALKPDGRGVTVVGDDAQSIYAFRAAQVRNILDFPTRFDPPARVVTLTRNYRSTPEILDAANAVLIDAAEGYAKTLWSGRPAGAAPRPRHRPRRDRPRSTTSAARSSPPARPAPRSASRPSSSAPPTTPAPLEVELARRDIPFVKFGGLKFLDAAHVKDVLACLRFAQNPADRIAGFRTLQLVPGIGPATAEALLDALRHAPEPALADTAPPRAADWPAFRTLYAALRAGDHPWPAEIEAVRAWYEPHLERAYDDHAARRADLLQLERIAATTPSRERFLTDVTLDPPAAVSDEAGPPHRDEDYLILSTIHSAKGQEWRQVFLLNCVDGCIPSDLGTGTTAEIEEERRLLHVAMTRARDRLHLLQPLRFFVHGQQALGGRHVHAARTRFIPDAVLDRFATLAWPPAEAPAAPGPRPQPRIDLKQQMRGLWT